MNDYGSFGKLRFECTTTAKQVLLLRILFIILSLACLGAGLLVMSDPEMVEAVLETELDIEVAMGVCFVLAVFFFLMSFRLVKHTKAMIYDDGLIYRRGNTNVIELDFNDLSGIIESSIVMKALLFVKVSETRTLTFMLKSGKKKELADAQLPQAKRFFEEAHTAVADYFLRGVTAENLNKLEISFGDTLELRDGTFTYQESKKKEPVYIPVADVYSIANEEEHSYSLKGKPDGDKADTLAVIRTDMGMNFETLFRIVEMVAQKRQ